MPEPGDEKRPDGLEEHVKGIKLQGNDETEQDGKNGVKGGSADLVKMELESPNGVPSPQRIGKKSASNSPVKQSGTPNSPAIKSEHEQVVGGDITLKNEPGQAPKLSRSSSKKIQSRPPTLYLDLPDSSAEALSTFERIKDCIYANKYLGSTDHALECDCHEEWDVATATNNACGEDSDCINRATKMECVGECDCGAACQNQRFQRRQYAKVAIIKTEKKGYGLRAETDLRPGQFIFEYIGEVIGEASFRRRMQLYDQENIKHFYFMSLSKGEFVDATKKGNFGRFCNHSCNPNCYVDKWVVGDKLRMGIFAERLVKAGEELVFNYNVDRYGANPQPCYCGEPNCTGFIGGKTQTERATKLSALTIEALGLEDADDWDLATSKKPRKKKTGEDDEEYVESMQPRSLDESGVTKVMATLMQCKEKWIAVKLLSRIQRCEDSKVRNRVVKMHGYQILNSTLTAWMEDDNVVLQILDILDKLPRLTRNKIQDSKIEPTVEKLTARENEDVKTRACSILKIWSTLEVGYRIPRIKRDPAAIAAANKAEREERRQAQRERSRSRSSSVEAPKGPAAPTGPRSGAPGRGFPPPRPAFRRPFPPPLPSGWFSATANGQTYYYSADGQTTWQRPTVPASQPPPPPKVMTNEQKLQEIINSITKSSTPNEKPSSASASGTPKAADTPKKPERKEKSEKWKSYNKEKQMKLYENTLFPHIKHVMDKYKSKLGKEDLKRFAKEAGKNLVKSDYKHNRVDDPTKISSKQEKQVKKYVKEYFDKAVLKKRDHDKRKAEKKANAEQSAASSTSVVETSTEKKDDEDDPMPSSPDVDDDAVSPPASQDPQETPSADLKRKAEAILAEEEGEDAEAASSKRIRSDDTPPPPPPPPPPPGNADDEQSYEPQIEDSNYHSLPPEPLKASPEMLLANGAAFDQNGLVSATNITPDSLSDRPDIKMDISTPLSEADRPTSHFATPPADEDGSATALSQAQRFDIRQHS